MDICGVIDSVKTNAGFAEQQKVNFSGTVLSIVNSFFSPLLCKKKSDSWCRWAAGRILVWSNDLNRKNKIKKKIKLNFKKTKEKKKKLLNSLLLRCQQPSSSHCFPLSTSLLCLLSSSFAVLSCEWRLRTTVSAVVGELRRWRGL